MARAAGILKNRPGSLRCCFLRRNQGVPQGSECALEREARRQFRLVLHDAAKGLRLLDPILNLGQSRRSACITGLSLFH